MLSYFVTIGITLAVVYTVVGLGFALVEVCGSNWFKALWRREPLLNGDSNIIPFEDVKEKKNESGADIAYYITLKRSNKENVFYAVEVYTLGWAGTEWIYRGEVKTNYLGIKPIGHKVMTVEVFDKWVKPLLDERKHDWKKYAE